MAFVLSSSPVYAEVCDKERPDWNGTTVTPFDELMFFLATPVAIVLLCLWVLAWYSIKRWAAYAIAGYMLFTLQLKSVDHITLAAIKEGCVGSVEYIAAFLGTLSIIIVARAHWKT